MPTFLENQQKNDLKNVFKTGKNGLSLKKERPKDCIFFTVSGSTLASNRKAPGPMSNEPHGKLNEVEGGEKDLSRSLGFLFFLVDCLVLFYFVLMFFLSFFSRFFFLVTCLVALLSVFVGWFLPCSLGFL